MSTLQFNDKRILVIEDHAEMRSSMKSMLDRLGGRKVDMSITGEEAIEYLRNKDYDLVLSDYELGRGKDGQQVLEETRHAKLLRAGAAYVMVTAAQTIEMVMGALEYHPDGYVTKPITFDALHSRLRRIFKHKSYFQHIDDAIDNNQIDLALKECDRLINTTPKLTLPTQRIKGKLLFDNGDIVQAKTVYESVLDTRPVAWAKLGLSKCLHKQGDRERAIEELEQTTQANQRYVECYDLLARIYEELGESLKSQEILMAAVEQSPKAILRQTHLAELALRNKDYDTATKAARKAVGLSKNSCHNTPNNYLNLARALQEKLIHGGYRDKTYALTEIRSALDSVRKNSPLDHEIHIRANILEAMTLNKQGKKQTAKNMVLSSREIFSTLETISDTRTIIGLLEGLLECVDNTEGEKFLNEVRAKKLLPNDDLEELLKEATKSSDHRQNEITESYNNRAVSLFEKGKLRDAVGLFAKAVNNDKASFGVLLNAIQALVVLMQKNGVTPDHRKTCNEYLTRVSNVSENDPRHDRYVKLKKMFEELIQ